jgi:polyhydroxyalkanoate synthase
LVSPERHPGDQAAAQDEVAHDSKVSVVGYCLSGTLAAISATTMAQEQDERLASLTLLAMEFDQ